jgi:glycosyltransferase involved in cell wall biosynthesis
VEIDFFMPHSGKEIAPTCAGLNIIGVAKTELTPYLFVSKKGQAAGYGQNLIRAVEEYGARCAEAVVGQGKSRQYDLIHAHDWLTALAASSTKSALGAPLVHTFHSTEFDRTSSPWDYVLNIEKSAAARADLIIAVSRRTRDQVARLGADTGKIRVVYNGVDASKFAASSLPKSAGEYKNGKKLVLFLGRLTEQKGPVQFLHAAKKVLSIYPDTVFAIAGKGEMLPLLINMSLELGISKNVRFLGFVPEEDQQKIYKLADVYVMPSTSEPFGITALEAMSSGVPVIVSKTSGVAEIAKSAIKVDFWDINAMAQKIIAVLRYAPLARTMSRMSSEESRSYPWGKTADETLAVYREAIARQDRK